MLRGEAVHFAGPAEAIRNGIGMVHQHFKLAPSFTVADNIILGAEPLDRAGRLDRKAAERACGELSRRFGLDLDPRAVVGTLPVGLRQRVEILKALYRDAEILILDEPTAVLTPQETRELFATLRSLARSGRAIIFITHKLREVLAVSDRISVMRLGRIIATMDNKGVTAEEIANLMVGRAVLLRVAKGEARPTPEPLLTVEGLVVAGDRGETAVDDLSLSVRAGEIVGLAGVQGNGQDELVEAITGLRRPLSGAVEVCGTSLRHADPRAARAAGLAYVPADRGRVGLSLLSRVWENLTLGHQRELSRGPLLASGAARRRAGDLIRSYDIRGAGEDTLAGSLSGGNQQKVQLARELTRSARLIVAEQPSQGVDIGAIEAIHRTLVQMRDAGRAVLRDLGGPRRGVLHLRPHPRHLSRAHRRRSSRPADTNVEEVGRLMGGLHEDHTHLERARQSGRRYSRMSTEVATMLPPAFTFRRLLGRCSGRLVAIVIAVVVGGDSGRALRQDPVEVYWTLIQGSLVGWPNLSVALQMTTPLIFTGLAVAFSFRAGLWNIGAEGQMLVGALVRRHRRLCGRRCRPGCISRLPALPRSLGGLLWAAVPATSARLSQRERAGRLPDDEPDRAACDWLCRDPCPRRRPARRTSSRTFSDTRPDQLLAVLAAQCRHLHRARLLCASWRS